MKAKGIKLKGISVYETERLFPSTDMILVGYRGSIAHGMYKNPNDDSHSIDDKDILGVCFGPMDSYIGLGKFEQKEAFIGEWDCVTYEIRKFIRLLMKMNPNVLSLLWIKPEHYIYISPAGQLLLDNRNLFVCREAYRSFTGYAYHQLNRMTKGVCQGYMGEKRKRLVEKYGYDTKNASHLIRLLRTGIEFLKDGELHVHRHDASQLLAIKHGEWTLEKVKREAEDLFKRAETAYQESKLPLHVDSEAIKKLTMEIVGSWIRWEIE